MPGVMLATPSLVGDRLYITTEDGIAAALDTATGETVWSYEIGSPSDSAPAVTGDAIYVGARDHRLLALNREDGTLLWERNLGNIVLGSAIVVDGTVYIGSTNGKLEALDAATGDPRWSARIKGWVVGHPASDGSVVAAASLGERFITVEPETGASEAGVLLRHAGGGGPIIADRNRVFRHQSRRRLGGRPHGGESPGQSIRVRFQVQLLLLAPAQGSAEADGQPFGSDRRAGGSSTARFTRAASCWS